MRRSKAEYDNFPGKKTNAAAGELADSLSDDGLRRRFLRSEAILGAGLS